MKDYKKEAQELRKQNKELRQETSELVDHVLKIKRLCNRRGLWLSAGIDPYLPQTDEDQQGPLVTKLYEIADKLHRDMK